MNVGKQTGRLGRGLEALLGEEPLGSAPASRADVAVSAIEANPYQPRKIFDDEELGSLRDSIGNHGVLQPLVVRQVGDRYELIAGERRLRAAKLAGLDHVPVTVVDFNDQQSFEAALVENIQRADLNPMDKATGFRDYLARYQMTHEQLAARLGMGRPTITNLVALLDLPDTIQEMVRSGALSVGHAKAIKGLPDADKQLGLAREIIARGMSVHATEAFVKTVGAEQPEGEEGARRRPRPAAGEDPACAGGGRRPEAEAGAEGRDQGEGQGPRPDGAELRDERRLRADRCGVGKSEPVPGCRCRMHGRRLC